MTSLQQWDQLEERMIKRSAPGAHPGLARVRLLYQRLGNPQRFPSIHIAGTNGKGSTSAFLASIYQEAGYKVAQYTSPHLVHMGERLMFNQEPASRDLWLEAADVVEQAVSSDPQIFSHRPTYFETFTAAAYWMIAQQNVDVAIIETGLGGRLDATNVLDQKKMAIITSIGFDHMEFLGDTLEQIAAEKFGIISEHGLALLQSGQKNLIPLFYEHCEQKKAQGFVRPEPIQIHRYQKTGSTFSGAFWGEEQQEQRFEIGLPGTFQPQNAALAAFGSYLLKDQLPLTVEQVQRGLKKARWPGRMEYLSYDPDIMLDGAHNAHGLKALAQSLKDLYGDQPLSVVFAAMSDKNFDEGLSFFDQHLKIHLFATEVPHNDRSAKAQELADRLRHKGLTFPINVESNYQRAIQKARELGRPLIICGSLYFIGLVRRERNDWL